ncbi:MAG: hypothetical protein WCU88_07315 [Elusimicrobiota bacterium]|jgi:hypothetical protein
MRTKDLYFYGLTAFLLFLLLASLLLNPFSAAVNFGDLYAYHWPLRHLSVSCLQSGRLPFWNPYIFAGLPLLANPQAALFYPPSVLFAVLPVGWAFSWFSFLHLCWAAFGMQLFLRKAGSDAAGAGLLAAAFALSPMLIYRLPQGIPSQLAVLSWAPWTWWAMLSGRIGLLSAAWALQFLAGHPQYAMINACGLLLLAIRRPGESRGPGIVFFLSAAAAAMGFCAVQLAPTAEFLTLSNRVGWGAGSAAAYSLPLKALISVIFPWSVGTPWDAGFAGWPSEFFEFNAAGIGLVLAALAVIGAFPMSSRKAFGSIPFCMVCAGAFFALGGNNPLLPLEHLPLLGLLRAPARFSFLLFFGLLLCAWAGWRALCEKGRLPHWVKAAVFTAVLLELGGWSVRFVSAEEAREKMAPSQLFVGALAGRVVRFSSSADIASPNKAMMYRAMNISGYEAFYLKGFSAYMSRHGEGGGMDASRFSPQDPASAALRPLGNAWGLGLQGLRHIPGAAGLGLGPEDFAAVVQERSPDQWRVFGTASVSGRAFFSMPAYPGWRAWVNGVRSDISVKEDLFQGVEVPAGQWDVCFRFIPRFWMLWVFISFFSTAWWAMSVRRLFP